jgi:hypothetical protein
MTPPNLAVLAHRDKTFPFAVGIVILATKLAIFVGQGSKINDAASPGRHTEIGPGKLTPGNESSINEESHVV